MSRALSKVPVPAAIQQLRLREGCGLAVFDADGVLWHGDVSEDFARWMIAEGEFDGALWADYDAVAQRDAGEACFKILGFYTGMQRDDIDRHVARFWRDGPARRWLAVARDAVALVRDAGLRVFVVSGTPAPVLRPLPDHLAIDGVLALDLEFDADDRATGRSAGIPTVGDGKAARIRAREPGPVWLAAGNSYLDIAMLGLSEGVGWAVNPDAQLRRAAERAGWAITDEAEGVA